MLLLIKSYGKTGVEEQEGLIKSEIRDQVYSSFVQITAFQCWFQVLIYMLLLIKSYGKTGVEEQEGLIKSEIRDQVYSSDNS